MKAWCSDHTPTRWWPRPICTCTKEMTLNDKAQQSKASLCNNGLLFCVEAFTITKVSRLHVAADEKLACWTEGFTTAELDFDNFGVSLTGSLVLCIHSSRSVLQQPFTGQTLFSWKTDCREPSCSHRYQFASTYHIITLSIPSWLIFLPFIFSRRRVCPRKSRKFALSENFLLYGIYHVR